MIYCETLFFLFNDFFFYESQSSVEYVAKVSGPQLSPLHRQAQSCESPWIFSKTCPGNGFSSKILQ